MAQHEPPLGFTRDTFGNLWPERFIFCPTCGLPDNCGDCDHTPWMWEQVVHWNNRQHLCWRATLVYHLLPRPRRVVTITAVVGQTTGGAKDEPFRPQVPECVTSEPERRFVLSHFESPPLLAQDGSRSEERR